MRKPAAADLGIDFVVALPEDGMRRTSCKAELLQVFARVCIPRGIKGADLVKKAETVPGNRNLCMLKLSTAGKKCSGWILLQLCRVCWLMPVQSSVARFHIAEYVLKLLKLNSARHTCTSGSSYLRMTHVFLLLPLMSEC